MPMYRANLMSWTRGQLLLHHPAGTDRLGYLYEQVQQLDTAATDRLGRIQHLDSEDSRQMMLQLRIIALNQGQGLQVFVCMHACTTECMACICMCVCMYVCVNRICRPAT